MFTAKPADGIVWITGASSGIGRQVALVLAAEGFRVAVSARRGAELDALAAGIAEPGAILPYPCDMTDRAAVADTFARIVADHGPVALAFLNVGMFAVDWRAPFDAQNAWTTMEGNVKTAINALDPVIAHMSANRRGQIVLNSSLSSYIGLPGAGYYGASKATLLHLAETMRPQLSLVGVTVQIVNCGFIRTPLTSGAHFPMPFLMTVEAAVDRIVKGMRSGRFEITFPRRLSWFLKLLRIMPYWLVLPLTARVARRATRRHD
jgi:short-subunit dehydrogenase